MKSLIPCSLFVLLATVGCSDRGGVVVGGNSPDASTTGNTMYALGINDTCTAQAPPGFLNPTNKQFVASPGTGTDLLALLAAPYAATYMPYGGAGTALTVGATYSGGMVTCSGLECSCDPPGPCSVDRCAGPFVNVEIDATYVTADGTFNEDVDTILTAPNGDGSVRLEGRLPATQLHGTYQVKLGTPSQVSLEFFVLFSGTQVVQGAVDELTPTMTGGGGAIR